jgi:hypothetical protein
LRCGRAPRNPGCRMFTIRRPPAVWLDGPFGWRGGNPFRTIQHCPKDRMSRSPAGS